MLKMCRLLDLPLQSYQPFHFQRLAYMSMPNEATASDTMGVVSHPLSNNLKLLISGSLDLNLTGIISSDSRLLCNLVAVHCFLLLILVRGWQIGPDACNRWLRQPQSTGCHLVLLLGSPAWWLHSRKAKQKSSHQTGISIPRCVGYVAEWRLFLTIYALWHTMFGDLRRKDQIDGRCPMRGLTGLGADCALFQNDSELFWPLTTRIWQFFRTPFLLFLGWPFHLFGLLYL